MVAMDRLSVNELKEMPLKNRLMVSMAVYMTDKVFYEKAADKLRERQPKDHDKWDANDVSRIKDFNRNVEECINSIGVLSSLYESEFDDYKAAEKAVKLYAEEMANLRLISCHWIKEGK